MVLSFFFSFSFGVFVWSSQEFFLFLSCFGLVLGWVLVVFVVVSVCLLVSGVGGT